MKKCLYLAVVIIALFAAIFAVTQMEEKNASTSQKIDNATDVRQMALTTIQMKFFFQISKRI